jgi:taurine dioxygenase
MLIRPLAGSFGAEVTAFDLRRLRPADRRRVRRALHEYLLLVFRDLELSGDDQVALTGIFGDVDERVSSRDLPFRLPEDPRIQVVSNHPRAPAVTRSTVFWHTDQSYKPDPSPVIVLKAVVVSGASSATQFADMRAAYDALPARSRAVVAPLAARHCFGALLGAAAVTAPRTGGTVHSLVREHAATGRRSLYLNQFSIESVVGMPKGKGLRLLSRLHAHAVKPAFVYEHAWRPGDVLVWDNLSLMHRAAGLSASRRVLHRTHTRAHQGRRRD